MSDEEIKEFHRSECIRISKIRKLAGPPCGKESTEETRIWSFMDIVAIIYGLISNIAASVESSEVERLSAHYMEKGLILLKGSNSSRAWADALAACARNGPGMQNCTLSPLSSKKAVRHRR